MPSTTVTLIVAATLAAGHVGARYLAVADHLPRRAAWLSVASGVSVAYVFVQLLPEVAAVQVAISETDAAGALPWLEAHAWLLALIGLGTFYALEVHAQRAKSRSETGRTSDQIGRLHIACYAVYNAIIGYLLLQEAERGAASLLLFTVAIGLHLLVNDSALRRDHGDTYHDVGRWVLAAAVLLGWVLSTAVELTEAAVGLPLALVSGAIVLTVMKEELPVGRDGRIAPFVAGAVGYSVLLLAAA
jgi:hypothetical protein